jgi:hypothetical protein
VSEDDAARALVAFLADVGDAPEVIWCAGLAMLERAIAEAREARHGRFGVYPEGQLRRLRRGLAQGLLLTRLAVAMQAAERERGRELDEELREQAAAVAAARRRAQTLPAQLARLEKQRRRRELEQDGVPPGNFHLRPEYPG